jgi:acetylornithine/succinyldiaminopimelate/putrescine aminotransferase
MLLEIEKAEGVFLYSSTGEKYLDLISGVSVSNTGHRHPKVVQAVKDQIDAYMHLMVYGEYIQCPQVKYAERLASLLPGNLNSCYFVNSGSEAVEGGLKLAKKITGRSRIISFKNSYHGSTHGALAIQGAEKYKSPFRPLIPDTFQLEFNNTDSLSFIDERTACVIIEPIQGEAGIIVPENDFLRKVRQRCSEVRALLIFDEIQTGFGRTGLLFALNRYNVVPDILLLAKALGGGMPLGAFISSHDIMSSLAGSPSLGHITTFGGHPVCCAAGLASLNVIIDENLVNQCNRKSGLFKEILRHPLIEEIRGEGLMLAVQLISPVYVNYVISKAPQFGIILDYFLFNDISFRIAPPLTISDGEISQACSRLIDLLDDAKQNVEVK